MKTIGVIPARWGSTRFEGKVLAMIAGKPMIQHVWQRASQARRLDHCLIACDHPRVLETAKEFGAEAVLTSTTHASGTDRISEVVSSMEVDVVVNIQGDEPLIDPAVIDALVQALEQDPSCQMATVIKGIERQEELNNPHVVKVVTDHRKNALYFSRALIPYNRQGTSVTYYKHLGLYAYRKDLLMRLKDLPRSSLEEAEKLEQLRVLEAGYTIKTILTDRETMGVDTPEDLKKVEEMMHV